MVVTKLGSHANHTKIGLTYDSTTRCQLSKHTELTLKALELLW